MPASTPPDPLQVEPLPPLSALRRTAQPTSSSPSSSSYTLIQAPPSTSPDSLLHLIQRSQQQQQQPTSTSTTTLPTPSLDALAEMDLTALRQLALQRGDSVSAAFQAFAQARASNQHRREEFNRMLDELEADEEDEEQDDELADEDAYFDDLFSRSGDLTFFPPDEEDEEDVHGILGFGDNLTDEEVEMGAHWPGLLAERPLNPYDPPPLAIPPGLVDPSFFPSIHATSSLPPSPPPANADPPSSTSFSSFLQPGVLFQGTQSFERRQPSPPSASSSTATRVARDSLSDFVLRSAAGSGSALSTLDRRNGNPSTLRPWGPQGSSYNNEPYALPLPLPSLSTSFPHLSNPTSSNALDMDLASSALSGSRSSRQREEEEEDPPSSYLQGVEWGARLRRERIARGVQEGGRWAAAAGVPRVGGVGEGREERDRREDEQWGVQVVLHTYCPLTHTLSGLMHAVGVPSSPSPITTFFTGSTISLSTGEPLFSHSHTTPGTSTKQAKMDAEYWCRLGPFKGVGREELKARSGDQRWLEERTKGWVLMRWKEREFVNVAPTECTLTIAGHYLIALNRATGDVEGLYCDPSTPPYQRLQLSPAVPGGRFALGAFEFR